MFKLAEKCANELSKVRQPNKRLNERLVLYFASHLRTNFVQNTGILINHIFFVYFFFLFSLSILNSSALCFLQHMYVDSANIYVYYVKNWPADAVH